MAVKILHKRSAVEFKSATGAQLEFGELGLNYHESGPYLQCKDAAGEIVQLGGVYIGSSAPGNELKGAWWLRDSDFTLFLYDGTRWVSIAGGGGGGGTGDITAVIGGDGIEATEVAGLVTVEVDLASNSHGLSIVGGKLTADIATTSSLGTVKIGDGIDVDTAGEISVDLSNLDVNADLEYVPNGNEAAEITNTAGDNATVPIATDSVAGLFTGDEKQKLAGIEEGAAANQDLSYASAPDKGTVEITDGTDAVIPVAIAADSTANPATTGTAGLFTGLEKEKLDGIEPGAQVNDSYDKTESDDRYLRVDADAPDQTRVAGKTTFDETITVNGVIQVNDQTNGFNGVSGNDQIALYSKGVQRAVFSDVIRLRTPGRNDVATAVKVNVIDPISPKPDGTAAAVALNVETGVDQNATQYTGIQHDYTDVGGAVAGEVSAFKSQPNIADVGSVNIGFHSILDSASAGENYHFYGQGDQPSFTNGAFYIGGTTARNTFDLWKSTLTDEQLEQLEAGTLVAPANVATPGDGEFARQWWYDQQDAETQAAIDAGELDYPEHLAAATFTDTFALGDNTQINLLSNGNGRFRGSVTAQTYTQNFGSLFTQVTDPAKPANLGLLMGSTSGSGIGIRSVNTGITASQLGANCPRLIFNRCTDPNGLQLTDINSLIKNDLVPCEVGAILGEFNFSTSQGATDIYLARFTAYSTDAGGELELSLHNTNTDTDYQYFFDPEGFFGFRFNNQKEFFINVDQDNNTTKLDTTKERLTFNSANGHYVFQSNDFGANFDITTGTDFMGISTGAAVENSKYGIKHIGARPVSLVNTNGEIRLNNNGNSIFLKGGDSVTITPGGTSPGASAGTINATASAANTATTADTATTATTADKIPFDTFSTTNNRRIACFGVNLTSAASGTTQITYPAVNGPQINGDGIIRLNADLNANGNSINGAVFFIATEPDDPAAYQTTYSLDEDGQQVAEQSYVGATENLLEIINDLRARVAALEAAQP